MYKLDEIKYEYALYCDPGDRWGSAMVAFFDVAEELYRRAEYVPDEWRFSPGAAGPPDPEIEPPGFDIVLESDSDALVAFGNILHRYTRQLDYLGESY